MTTTDQALDAANSMITAMRHMTQDEHQELAHLRAEVHRLQADSSKAIAALAECIGERDKAYKAGLSRASEICGTLQEFRGDYIHAETAIRLIEAEAALKGETSENP